MRFSLVIAITLVIMKVLNNGGGGVFEHGKKASFLFGYQTYEGRNKEVIYFIFEKISNFGYQIETPFTLVIQNPTFSMKIKYKHLYRIYRDTLNVS